MTALGAPVPTIVASTSDAVGARIVASAQDSGLENMHARVQPERYQRQLRLFHEIVGFRKLGLVYEDSPSGRSYAAVDAVRQIAMEKGFSVRACDARASGVSAREATANVLHCYQELEGRVDAVYVTVSRGLTPAAAAAGPDPARGEDSELLDAGLRGSARRPVDELGAGGLLYVGRFHAETMARIFNGARPRQLTQVWVDPAKIALNLKRPVSSASSPRWTCCWRRTRSTRRAERRPVLRSGRSRGPWSGGDVQGAPAPAGRGGRRCRRRSATGAACGRRRCCAWPRSGSHRPARAGPGFQSVVGDLDHVPRQGMDGIVGQRIADGNLAQGAQSVPAPVAHQRFGLGRVAQQAQLQRRGRQRAARDVGAGFIGQLAVRKHRAGRAAFDSPARPGARTGFPGRLAGPTSRAARAGRAARRAGSASARPGNGRTANRRNARPGEPAMIPGRSRRRGRTSAAPRERPGRARRAERRGALVVLRGRGRQRAAGRGGAEHPAEMVSQVLERLGRQLLQVMIAGVARVAEHAVPWSGGFPSGRFRGRPAAGCWRTARWPPVPGPGPRSGARQASAAGTEVQGLFCALASMPTRCSQPRWSTSSS